MAFKGEAIRAADLMNFMPVEFPELPERQQAARFGVIRNLGPALRGLDYLTVQFTGYDAKAGVQGTHRICLPKSFMVKKLTGRLGQELRRVASANIDPYIQGIGMCLGADPEIFLENEGKLLPAFEVLPKQAAAGKGIGPAAYCQYGTFYYDGFAAEIGACAADCLAWPVDSVHGALAGILAHVRRTYPKAKFLAKTIVEIDQDILDKATPEQVQLGCAPSLNVYGIKTAKPDGRSVTFRCAGGHPHFGLCVERNCVELIKTLDAVVGIAGVSLFAQFDNPVRRTLYGLPGEYRLPAHGLEYRTLSNAWLFHPAIMNLVFELARVTIRFGYSGLRFAWQAEEAEIVEVIRYCDVKAARKILERNRGVLLTLLNRCNWAREYCGTQGLRVILNGMESAVRDPLDIERNWAINNPRQTWIGHCEGYGADYGHNWFRASQILRAGKQI